MPHVQWKDRYNINFREIDAQHQGLLEILNGMIDLLEGRSPAEPVDRLFTDLADYAGIHFSSEERYMQAAGYPKLAEHRLEHDVFTSKVLALQRDFNPTDPHFLTDTVEFLKHWYLDHITKADQDYAPFLQRALPTAEIKAVFLGLQGVFCGWDRAAFTERMAAACGKPAVDVGTALWEDPALFLSLENGTMDGSGFTSAFAGWAGSSIPQEGLASAYAACCKPIAAMVQLVRGLKAHYQVALVGNAPPWLPTHGYPAMGLEAPFHAEALSCDVGARLPDSTLYLEAAALLKVPPEACLLIHDDPACLDSAQKARLQTLHFTKPVMLMAELRRMAVPF
jgi:hemerythrin